jgi:hypothetical protein
MNDKQKAWRLWNLMHEVSDALWDCNEQAFLDFCIEDSKQNISKKTASAETKEALPF